MEMNGEQILKKGKKTAKLIVWLYAISIIAIIGAVLWATYREEKEKPEPIDFTTDGAIGMAVDKYAYLDVQGLTSEVAIYGDVENESSSTNDRYYIALNEGYMYIVDLDFDTINLLKPWQDYTYSQEENPTKPEPVKIYGMTESIPRELKKMVLDYYNEGLKEEEKIKEADFNEYFGSVLLNVRRSPVDTSTQTIIMVAGGFVLFIVFVVHLSLAVEKARVKKYLKKNEYEEELVRQLDDFVEEKHFKDKIIFTKDFYVDIKYGSFVVFKYSDVKWIHIHNVKSHGAVTSSNLVVYLRDGKTKFTCLKTSGGTPKEFMEVFDKLCEKLPDDCLKGFTSENRKAFKEYKKSL